MESLTGGNAWLAPSAEHRWRRASICEYKTPHRPDLVALAVCPKVQCLVLTPGLLAGALEGSTSFSHAPKCSGTSTKVPRHPTCCLAARGTRRAVKSLRIPHLPCRSLFRLIHGHWYSALNDARPRVLSCQHASGGLQHAWRQIAFWSSCWSRRTCHGRCVTWPFLT